MFDSRIDLKSNFRLYSIVENVTMMIQGRANNFSVADQVPLGLKSGDGTFTIAIEKVDGLFENNAQTIYLEDKFLNVIHNLSANPYNFTKQAGIADNRFVLRYNNVMLDNAAFETEKSVIIYKSNDVISISSKNNVINSVIVFDVLGRKLFENNTVNDNDFEIKNIAIRDQTILVKIGLENEQSVVKKIIF